MDNCLFCKIIKKEIPATIIFENENLLVFKDIQPQANKHLLAIPKTHHKDFIDFSRSDKFQGFFDEVASFAKELGEFRLVSNCGEKAGQTVFHVHFHLLADEKLGSFGR